MVIGADLRTEGAEIGSNLRSEGACSGVYLRFEGTNIRADLRSL